jgi:hypothetical protein
LSGISLGTVGPYSRRLSERKKSQVSTILLDQPTDLLDRTPPHRRRRGGPGRLGGGCRAGLHEAAGARQLDLRHDVVEVRRVATRRCAGWL